MRALTWNVHGGQRPDMEAIADVVAGSGADVVALQEVQRRQARALGGRLGFHCTWRRKHRPLVRPAEGQAILTRTRPIAAQAHVLRDAPPWSFRRRIAVSATVASDAGEVLVVCPHLASGDAEQHRLAEVARLLDAIGPAQRVVLAGDLNAEAGASTVQRLVAAGFRDPWTVLHRARVATCWAPGDRTGAPTQQLDHVLVRGGEPVDVHVIDGGGPHVMAALSDHLPVAASVRWAPG